MPLELVRKKFPFNVCDGGRATVLDWAQQRPLTAVVMVLVRRGWKKHAAQFMVILNEILVIRNPEQLAAIAAERKPTMLLLPYGIPIAIGTIAYFLWTGMLV